MTTAQKKGGAQGRATGLNFEKVFMNKYGGKEPQKCMDIWGERKTVSKTDVLAKGYRYSIKNPKSKSTSTQIQVCSVDRFCRLFNIDGDLKVSFDQFFGNHGFFKDKALFKEHCENVWNIDTKGLCSDSEIRRNRLLFNNVDNNYKIVEWFENNIREVLEFVFKNSFNDPSNEDVIANRICWTEKQNCMSTRQEYDIDLLINDIIPQISVNVRESQSVIEMGPLTLQMKGSGKGSSYHNMQFNASLNDIARYSKTAKVTPI